jgi:hypothetical protein
MLLPKSWMEKFLTTTVRRAGKLENFEFDRYSSQTFKQIGNLRYEVMHPTKSDNPRIATFVVIMEIDREIATRISLSPFKPSSR